MYKMRTIIFALFSVLIAYLTRSVWLALSPWYFKIIFLVVIILTPFILYSMAAKIAFKFGWLGGLLTMIFITIIDNYLTKAFSLCILSKCHSGLFDFSGFKLDWEVLKLSWYTYLVSGAMGLLSGALGDRQRQIEEERRQRAMWFGVYLLAGQFLGMAVPEITPVITRMTPVVETVILTEASSKTGSIIAAESNKIADGKVATEVSEKTTKIIRKPASGIFDPYRPYNRTAINKVFRSVKNKMHIEGLKRGQSENITSAVFTDGYTGKRLVGGENYEFDHIRSAESMHTKYKPYLTDEEIAQVVNCPENITTTITRINRAKGNKSLEVFLRSGKAAEIGVNAKLVKRLIEKADTGMEIKVQEILSKRK